VRVGERDRTVRITGDGEQQSVRPGPGVGPEEAEDRALAHRTFRVLDTRNKVLRPHLNDSICGFGQAFRCCFNVGEPLRDGVVHLSETQRLLHC
jgi:hypothetical protein